MIVLTRKLAVLPALSFSISQRRWSAVFFFSVVVFISGISVENKSQLLFPTHTFVCAHKQTRVHTLHMHASTHKELLLVHSQKRLDTAVFSSVEIGTIPSPVNNSLTSAHAAVIAAELERFFNWPSCWKAIAGFDNLWLHLRGTGAKVGGGMVG